MNASYADIDIRTVGVMPTWKLHAAPRGARASRWRLASVAGGSGRLLKNGPAAGTGSAGVATGLTMLLRATSNRSMHATPAPVRSTSPPEPLGRHDVPDVVRVRRHRARHTPSGARERASRNSEGRPTTEWCRY